jgi:hypothetical protein
VHGWSELLDRLLERLAGALHGLVRELLNGPAVRCRCVGRQLVALPTTPGDPVRDALDAGQPVSVGGDDGVRILVDLPLQPPCPHALRDLALQVRVKASRLDVPGGVTVRGRGLKQLRTLAG